MYSLFMYLILNSKVDKVMLSQIFKVYTNIASATIGTPWPAVPEWDTQSPRYTARLCSLEYPSYQSEKGTF